MSVREPHSARLLGSLPKPVMSVVAPDCVFLLPETWGREELARRAADETQSAVAKWL